MSEDKYVAIAILRDTNTTDLNTVPLQWNQTEKHRNKCHEIHETTLIGNAQYSNLFNDYLTNEPIESTHVRLSFKYVEIDFTL